MAKTWNINQRKKSRHDISPKLLRIKSCSKILSIEERGVSDVLNTKCCIILKESEILRICWYVRFCRMARSDLILTWSLKTLLIGLRQLKINAIVLVQTTAQIGGGPKYASWTNIRNMLNLHLCINQNLKNIKYSSRNWLFINFESGLPIINWVVRWLVLTLPTPFGRKPLFLRWNRLGVKKPQKTWILIFTSLKNFKKHEFYFL